MTGMNSVARPTDVQQSPRSLNLLITVFLAIPPAVGLFSFLVTPVPLVVLLSLTFASPAALFTVMVMADIRRPAADGLRRHAEISLSPPIHTQSSFPRLVKNHVRDPRTTYSAA